jgi:O-antigen/teichoic acid export membrane protein
MPPIRRIAGNIFSNWAALALTMGAAFFVAPFVVHRLGNVAYGVWVLVVSVNSYMGLLDLGLRGAVTRYVSRGVTQQNHTESAEAVSGALWIRVWMSVAIIASSFVFSSIFTKVFRIPPHLQEDARMAILATAGGLAITLSCGVFAGVLAGLQRFDQLSGVSILQTSTRVIGIVWLLNHGHGILALALWELASAAAANALMIFLCFKSYPQLKTRVSRPDRETMRKLWNYSSYAFLINVAAQIVYYTDNLVVGAFAGTVAVTFYAIGGSLVSYARQVVGSMTATFMPLASTFEAEGSHQNLRRLLIHGTRATLVVSLPIELALFLRGETFISLWMGAQYARPSGTVLRILLISLIVSSGSAACGGIVFGMEKHRPVAIWAILEGITNLSLSVFLVRQIGIYGVAWGTTIPSLIVEILLWPPYICHLVMISMREYFWQTWIRTGLAVLPFALACYLAERFWPARNLAYFFTQIVAVLPLFALGLAAVYWKEISLVLKSRVKSLGPEHVLMTAMARDK